VSRQRLVDGFHLEQFQTQVPEPIEGAVEGGLVRELGAKRGAARAHANVEVFERLQDGRDGLACESDLVIPGGHLKVTICGCWRPATPLRLLSADGFVVTLARVSQFFVNTVGQHCGHGDPERAAHLVREALALAEQHGFVQTVLGTAPRLVDHLISASTSYVSTDNLRALVTGGMESRHLAGLSTARTAVAALVDATTTLTLELSHVAVQSAPYEDVQILRRSEHFPAVPDLEFEGYEGSALKSY